MKMPEYRTVFGSLTNYEKGGVEVINDTPQNYVFSNFFEVASRSKPWEKVAVAKNMEYVIEAIRAEGVSPWRIASHDEFALVMDGQVTIDLLDPDSVTVDDKRNGSVAIEGEPSGKKMGQIVANRGHMSLLPANRCYRMSASGASVVLLQTIQGPDTIERWSDICQTY
jgi:hypothetical protein